MNLNFLLEAGFIYLIVLGVIIFFVILLDSRNVYETYSWIWVMIVLPILGIVLFFIFGRNWRRNNKKRQQRRKAIFDKTTGLLKEIYTNEANNIEELGKDLSKLGYEKIPTIAYAAPYMMVSSAEDIRIYHHGDKKFADLLKDIKVAKKYIHIEYYIFTSDDMTSKIFDAMIDRAQNGVEVRIFYDWFGSIKFSNKDKKRLKEAGVKVRSGKSPLDKINYRSHRKIVVIDAKIAYIGGMNMSEHYVTGGKFSEWRDTHLRVVGSLANSVQELFATYWFDATKEHLFDEKYLSITKPPKYDNLLVSEKKDKKNNAKMVQLIHSGADTEWATIRQVYEEMISAAKKTIILETPYFLPGESLYSALINAALSGVKVKVILAGLSDNMMSKNASFTFFRELLIAGVEIYLFKTGFMHGKSMTIDSKIATVGSANLDPRSMSINYESNLIIYDEAFTKELEEIYSVDFSKCDKVILAEYESVGFCKRLKWALFRLLSPIL
jgi:cardiolipin synthase